ncbi:hypothetical protein ACW14Y_42895 [Kitasatospora sp. cg17-2]
MSRAEALAAMVRAHTTACHYARLAAETRDAETADDARLMREAALALAEERLAQALGGDR